MPPRAVHLSRSEMARFPRESAFAEQLQAAATAGFGGVTLASAHGQHLPSLKHLLDATGLKVALIDLLMGDEDVAGPEMAGDPGRVAEFRNGLAMAIDHARNLGCDRVSCRVGPLSAGAEQATDGSTLVANIGYAGTMLAAAGIRLLIAADREHFETLRAAVGNPNLFWHAKGDALQDIAGGQIADLEHLLPSIGHIQLAGSLACGDSERLFRALDRLGYSGWISCDFHPDNLCE